jgi:hypothetical protein
VEYPTKTSKVSSKSRIVLNPNAGVFDERECRTVQSLKSNRSGYSTLESEKGQTIEDILTCVELLRSEFKKMECYHSN